MDNYLVIINGSNLSFAAIFACISLGFAILRDVDREEAGIGFWSASFASNSIGFMFWANIAPMQRWQMYIIGEMFHMLGFFALVYGAYTFLGHRRIGPALVVLLLWVSMWLVSVALLVKHLDTGVFMLRLLRSVIFVSAGIMILFQRSEKKLIGKSLAGTGMLLWGGYILVTALWRIVRSTDLQFGILAGFHVLAAFGMVAMVVDRIRLRAELSEATVKKLEKILPICSFCKKIRDEKDSWHSIETYVSEHSETEFSHGLCPDCSKKHYPGL